MTHGDALKLVGNGTFRMIREAVKNMKDEDFKDIHLDTYTVSIRKHMNDMYSGRVNDGSKTVHQFTNRSLPQVTAELMSVFEWYLPEDEPELQILESDAFPDDAIAGGLDALMDNYKKHNLANIYTEMENIRSEIRNNTVVDIIQVETNLMKLFDKLESYTHDIASKHNQLCNEAGDEVGRLESKLLELQNKIENLSSKPTTVEAYSPDPGSSSAVHNEHYFYMSKPTVTIEPNGRIKITFGNEWSPYDRENFLNDMKAKVIKR